jgi:hypothetical protein
MIVLGVDAGVMTGLAIVSGDDQRVLHHSTCDVETLQFQLTLLERTVDEVVVERSLPYKRSKLGRELHLVHTLVERACPEAFWIDASQWKNTEAKYAPVPRGISAHEKDAIRIARWYLLRFDSVPVPT